MLKLSLQSCSTVLNQLSPLAGDKGLNQRLSTFDREEFPYMGYVAQLKERCFTNSTNLSFIVHVFNKNHTNVPGSLMW